MIATERKHVYTARAFDRNNVYVCHKAKILGKEAVKAYKREARAQYKNIAYWRVFNDTLGLTVEEYLGWKMKIVSMLTPTKN